MRRWLGNCWAARGARDAERVVARPLFVSALALNQSDGKVSRLRRARISFAVLKKATAFFATGTIAPVRGLP